MLHRELCRDLREERKREKSGGNSSKGVKGGGMKEQTGDATLQRHD